MDAEWHHKCWPEKHGLGTGKCKCQGMWDGDRERQLCLCSSQDNAQIPFASRNDPPAGYIISSHPGGGVRTPISQLTYTGER